MLPEAKVTILVETFNGVDVIQVPLAVKPEFGTSRTYDLEGNQQTSIMSHSAAMPSTISIRTSSQIKN